MADSILSAKNNSEDNKQKDEQESVPFWERDLGGGGPAKPKLFKPKQLIQMYRGIGGMLKVQMTTSDALYYYAKGLPDKDMAQSLDKIREDIANGLNVHDAFERSQRFNPMTIGLVKSGSQAGRLDDAFKALAKRLETDIRFKKKVQKVVVIPCVIIPILLITFIIAQVKLVPQVEDMILGVGAEPDPVSKAAFAMSHFIQNAWHVIIILLLSIVGSLVFISKFRMFVLELLMTKVRMLRLLVMGLRQLTLLSTIKLLHSNGINLVQSLRGAAVTVTGSPLEQEVLEAADKYERMGLNFSMALSKYTSLDEQVCHMMAIGEQTASIDENLQFLADMYEDEAENQMEGLTQIINVVVLFVAVCLIGAVFLSTFLPIVLMGPGLMQNAL